MVQVTIVVRELGRLKPDYSLQFALPAVPHEGDYISIFRPDAEPHTEDVVVRKVWWHLRHGETRVATPEDDPVNGRVQDIMVECDQAIGPYATDRWRDHLEAAAAAGVHVERFEVERFSVRQDALPKGQASGERE